ncbi:sensor histidine kinase [Butyrivibrio sp.]|uniref:sensor histidine kinase n=1 Tax=Butyrivibrio sp. TaxID=28121 RepID=UPI0025BBC1EE|nr:histidine kinase [Butyrivibrio sp.]MBE5837532.1 hypothetical protein [Butyrivibrio sp.]MBE5843200.1 hypothetical protein [Butyrivibrio sp.]
MSKKIYKAINLALLFICIAGLILLAAVHITADDQIYAASSYSFFMLEPEAEETQPVDSDAGIYRTFSFTIPDNTMTQKGMELSLYLRQTSARVYLGEDTGLDATHLIYNSTQSGKDHISRATGNYWLSVLMRPEYAGRKLKIELYPQYKDVADLSPRLLIEGHPIFIVINHGELLRHIILPKDMAGIIISLVEVLAGLSFILLIFLSAFSASGRQRYICMSAIALSSGIWKLTTLKTTALITDQFLLAREIWFIGAVLYMLLPVFVMSYFFFEKNSAKIKRVPLVIFTSYVVIVTAAFVLQLFNLVELYAVLRPLAFLSSFMMIIMALSMGFSKTELIWLMPYPFAILADNLIYLFTKDDDTALFMVSWVLISLLGRGYLFVRTSIRQQKALIEKENELRQSQMQVLTSQIKPHFINNALTSIYALTESDPERAQTMIDNLSQYLSSNYMSVIKTEPVPFSDELSCTEAYIKIQKLRFGERIEITYDLQVTDFMLPPFTLQPLVENAIKYNQKNDCPLHIIIRTVRENNYISLTVEDDGNNTISSDETGTGIGLQNIKRRLYLMCRGTLEFTKAEAKDNAMGALVKITIPLQ